MLSIGVLLVLIVVVALAFDYINGFHDSANAIATVVSTRVMTPRMAIVMAAGLNFIGAMFSTNVAKTIASGLVDPHVASQAVVFSALIGAIVWNLITWKYGIPSSSSHALIGGLVGAAFCAGGPAALVWFGTKPKDGLVPKVLIPLFTSPLIGLVVGFVIMAVIYLLFHKAKNAGTSTFFKRLQVLSAAAMAFTHGQNDAQKSMGIITMALVAAGVLSAPNIPVWVVIACALAMALGTAGGGWRIIKTMGHKIVRLEPVNGFAAETAAATVLFATAHSGMPVSTTHVISGSIFGVGTAKRWKSVNWGVAKTMGLAWLFTIPASAGVAGLTL
ncbi:MAG: inorganic phosphate transporter [Armatimonadetes bacterium]|nr:inorganic phosphate transporter [Armatimonadota bacterium]